MKIALIIVAVLVTVIAVVAGIGAMLPKQHTASRSVVIHRKPIDVYNVIRDVASAPSWRPEVKRVEILGPARFREHGAHDAITYDVLDDHPGRRLVTRIADENLPYGGSWTWELEPVEGGTRVTITENGEVYNPIFRFVSRFIIGQASTIEKVLQALERRLA